MTKPESTIGRQLSATSPFRAQRVFRLVRKELREILRDRRTILTLIAMPLMLYPIMSVVFQQVTMARTLDRDTGPVFHFAALTTLEREVFTRRLRPRLSSKRFLHPGEAAPKKKDGDPSQVPIVRWWPSPERDPDTAEKRQELLTEYETEIAEGKLDLIVLFPEAIADPDAKSRIPSEDRHLSCKLIFSPNASTSLAALAWVERILAEADRCDLQERLGIPDLPRRITLLTPERVAINPGGRTGMVSLAALVPLILILMTITGAVYPAIDLTAGERERGTLEVLVASPVPRFELLTAKYFSVLTVAVMTAVVNLVCMTITITWSNLGAALFGGGGLSLGALAQIFALLMLFAGFFSAVLLSLTSFARSFKEAQAYLIPLMLASLAPGVMAMMPGMKLQGIFSVLPLVNIVLMARDVFEGGVEPMAGAIVVFTTLLYALAALSLAARVFGAESVLYSEQSSWGDLLRRPSEEQSRATIAMALWCLAVMVPIQFAINAIMMSLGPVDGYVGVVVTIFANLVLFGCVPAAFLYFGRVRIASGLGTNLPRPAMLAAGLLLGASLWPIELYLLENRSAERMLELRSQAAGVAEILQAMRTQVGWFILAIVIVPAIFEELFFRGVLFRALADRAGPLVTIGVSGILFGLTHVIFGGPLGLERLGPSTMLGLILAAVCWRSGSVWPSLIQHITHNTILMIVLKKYRGELHGIPWYWLNCGLAGTVVAAALFWYFGKSPGVLQVDKHKQT
ncbi:MAG: CPBP family intramembrane metalloprotease [Gemmataceae bacterium]|nr:CPBP family intramembrane metalloprotease [Gemmataceae bacterium]